MPQITVIALIASLVPVLGVLAIGQLWAGGGREIAYATIRMTAQLVAIGFVLRFLFAEEAVWLGILIVCVMVLASAVIATRLAGEARWTEALPRALLALALGGGGTLVFVLTVVLGLAQPFSDLRLTVPIAGMVFSNAMTGITLAAERLERERSAGSPPAKARRDAWIAAMIPEINALLAVGLVALPGMMTGQIIAGVDPLLAVRYQIVIMAMILEATGFSVAIYLWLAQRRVSAGSGARR
ncbi:ABC transporter permease [Parvularcula oceani]|uniref:ABC transporter permease n=1 Tax=Parvularcula oceani TaxID=1247963 RepID=UPI0004E0C51F|nr:ABC transporter permease [Parvularcula oceani]